MKTCFRCQKAQDYSQFQRDCTAKDGYRSSCKSCLRVRNKAPLVSKKPDTGFTSKPVSVDPKPVVKVPVMKENPYEKLSKKYGAFYTIAVSHDGTCRLQIFGNGLPTMIKVSNFNVDELLGIA